jgi:carbon monoxide dehydrogenase subunit G
MELDHDFTVPVPAGQAWRVLLDVERIAPCMPGATLDSVDGDDFTGRLKVKLGAMTITYRGSARIAARDEQSHTVTIEGSGKESRGSGTASATVQAQLHDEGEQTRVTVHTKLNVTGRPAQFGRNILSEVGGKLVGRFADNLAAELARDESAHDESAETSTAPAAPGGAAPTSAAAPAVAESNPATSGNGTSGTPAATSGTAAGPKAAGNGSSQAPGSDGSETAATGTPQPAESITGRSADGSPQPPATAPTTAKPAASKPAARPSAEAIDLFEFAGPSIAKRLAPLLAGVVALWTLRRLFRRSRR